MSDNVTSNGGDYVIYTVGQTEGTEQPRGMELSLTSTHPFISNGDLRNVVNPQSPASTYADKPTILKMTLTNGDVVYGDHQYYHTGSYGGTYNRASYHPGNMFDTNLLTNPHTIYTPNYNTETEDRVSFIYQFSTIKTINTFKLYQGATFDNEYSASDIIIYYDNVNTSSSVSNLDDLQNNYNFVKISSTTDSVSPYHSNVNVSRTFPSNSVVGDELKIKSINNITTQQIKIELLKRSSTYGFAPGLVEIKIEYAA